MIRRDRRKDSCVRKTACLSIKVFVLQDVHLWTILSGGGVMIKSAATLACLHSASKNACEWRTLDSCSLLYGQSDEFTW